MKIQNGGIVVPVVGQRLDFTRVGRQIDYVIFGAEFHFQKNAERQVAFGDKNTHDSSNGKGDYEGMFNLLKRHACVKRSSHEKFEVSRNENSSSTTTRAKSNRALGRNSFRRRRAVHAQLRFFRLAWIASEPQSIWVN